MRVRFWRLPGQEWRGSAFSHGKKPGSKSLTSTEFQTAFDPPAIFFVILDKEDLHRGSLPLPTDPRLNDNDRSQPGVSTTRRNFALRPRRSMKRAKVLMIGVAVASFAGARAG